MTELGEKFLAALADQGYGFVFTDEDLVILGANHRSRHHVPVIILEQPVYEFLLVAAIRGFAELDGRFNTDRVFGGGAGRN
jgi:hypothetical protein